jgi:hypothetical protein
MPVDIAGNFLLSHYQPNADFITIDYTSLLAPFRSKEGLPIYRIIYIFRPAIIEILTYRPYEYISKYTKFIYRYGAVDARGVDGCY